MPVLHSLPDHGFFPVAWHNYINQLNSTPFHLRVMLALYAYSPFLKFRLKDNPYYLLLTRFTLAEGALLLLDAGAFLVDALT